MSTFDLKGVQIRDPHIHALIYSVGAEGSTEYVDPAPLDVQHRLGRFRIDEGKLRIEPVKHYSSEDEAKAAFGPVLAAWEMEADLRAQVSGTIRFRFKTSEIIDRDPPPPGTSAPLSLKLRGQGTVVFGGDVVFKRTMKSYPPPPQAFMASPEVELAYDRWRRIRANSALLPTMAYFILTVLEFQAALPTTPRFRNRRSKKRDAAAQRYAIEPEILDKVGDLSSRAGAAPSSRKYAVGTPDLTDAERIWLESVIPPLIIRLGEHASGAALVPITPNEYPLP
jgi:hypothetical protein